MADKIRHKLTRIFAKPKTKANKYVHDRRSTLTDAEILEIRERLNIEIKRPKHMGSYQKPL